MTGAVETTATGGESAWSIMTQLHPALQTAAFPLPAADWE